MSMSSRFDAFLGTAFFFAVFFRAAIILLRQSPLPRVPFFSARRITFAFFRGGLIRPTLFDSFRQHFCDGLPSGSCQLQARWPIAHQSEKFKTKPMIGPDIRRRPHHQRTKNVNVARG